MDQNVVAVFIPIVFFLVAGLNAVVYFYLRSRERQMLIEKNLDAQSIKEFFNQKRKMSPYTLLKIGIICIAFGVALGLGLMLEDITYKDFWVPFSLFTVTGAGFVIANLVSLKLEKKNNNE
ncbi:MAG: DUF6249 domain-containing protein [Ignavibacteriaceae bacterium]|jgi:hypothetical protein